MKGLKVYEKKYTAEAGGMQEMRMIQILYG